MGLKPCTPTWGLGIPNYTLTALPNAHHLSFKTEELNDTMIVMDSGSFHISALPSADYTIKWLIPSELAARDSWS